MTLVKGLEAAGKDLTPESFKTGMETVEFDDPIGDTKIKYGPNDHQGGDDDRHLQDRRRQVDRSRPRERAGEPDQFRSDPARKGRAASDRRRRFLLAA